MKNLKLYFSPIDAKDQGVVFAAYDYRLRKEHNMRVCDLAKREYLARLSALQNELRQKYDGQFTDETEEDEKTWNKLSWEKRNAIEAKIEKEIDEVMPPDENHEDLYYT